MAPDEHCESAGPLVTCELPKYDPSVIGYVAARSGLLGMVRQGDPAPTLVRP
jgi:hypothetical protein